MLWAESPATQTAAQAVEQVVIPHQATAHGAAAAPGAPAAVPVAQQAQDPVQAAAADSKGAHTWAIIVAFGLVALGLLVARAIPEKETFRLGSTAATYGGLLVFAGAIERLLEPFSHWLPGLSARNDYDHAVAGMMNSDAVTLSKVAAAKAAMERAISDRAVLVWGIATAVSTAVASASGFYLLRAIASDNWMPTVPYWIDAVITGLVVGSGTKPLHDLITKAQTSKTSSSPQG